jgi:hypothetical protein
MEKKKQIHELIKCQHCGEAFNEPFDCGNDSLYYPCSSCKRGFDFESDLLKLPYCSYNSEILEDIYNIAVRIDKGNFYVNDKYEELIAYVLAGTRVDDKEIFSYGSSPRGLFKDGDISVFLKVCRCYLDENWK